MAKTSKAKHHHGEIGKCIECGDHAGAMKHAGHLLAVLKNGKADDDHDDGMESGDSSPAKGPKGRGLRARLQRFQRKS